MADFERQLSGIISGTKMNSHNRPIGDIQVFQPMAAAKQNAVVVQREPKAHPIDQRERT
jgi:hypothetical protein